MAAEYLMKRGHRKLMFAASRSDHQALAQRRNQFVETVRAQGASVQVVEGPESSVNELPPAQLDEIAHRVVHEFRSSADQPTAAFVGSDDLMVRVFNRLRQHGFEPGKDVELIGCNNDKQYMDQMYPRPATIDIKLDMVGERAIEQLLWRMSHPADVAQAQLLIKPEIVPAQTQGVSGVE
jgi:DNA-binding LacI/PurR family transcriptional regulator